MSALMLSSLQYIEKRYSLHLRAYDTLSALISEVTCRSRWRACGAIRGDAIT